MVDGLVGLSLRVLNAGMSWYLESKSKKIYIYDLKKDGRKLE